MGMRQSIAMRYGGDGDSETNTVYLYSHSGGGYGDSPLKEKLRTALARRQRWDDESYLARIIFSEVIKEEIEEETGYGLSPYVCEEQYPTIEVDFKNQTVDG